MGGHHTSRGVGGTAGGCPLAARTAAAAASLLVPRLQLQPQASRRLRLLSRSLRGSVPPARGLPPQLSPEPSGLPGFLARPDSAREDGGPRATGAESPAGRAGGALRRHGRGHEEREFLFPSPLTSPASSQTRAIVWTTQGLVACRDFRVGRHSSLTKGTGKVSVANGDPGCDAASPRESLGAGGAASEALPGLGLGRSLAGLVSEAGSLVPRLWGCWGPEWGAVRILCAPLPLLPSSVWGRGTAWMRFLFLSLVSGRRLSHSLSMSPGFLTPLPKIVPAAFTGRSCRTSLGKMKASPKTWAESKGFSRFS